MHYALGDFHVSNDTSVTGAKLISSFLIFTHVFLCTKRTSNCPFSVFGTKFAYGITGWE